MIKLMYTPLVFLFIYFFYNIYFSIVRKIYHIDRLIPSLRINNNNTLYCYYIIRLNRRRSDAYTFVRDYNNNNIILYFMISSDPLCPGIIHNTRCY